MPGLGTQLPQLLGGLGLVATGLGIGLLLLAWLRREATPGDRVEIGLLAAWAALPVGLFLLFRAGLDNFSLGLAAAGVLAGLGLNRTPWGPVLALGVLLGTTLPQLLPPPAADGALNRLGNLVGLPLQPQLRNAWRPYGLWSGEDVRRLLEASCPAAPEPCRVGTDQGLLQPHGEEPGQLELFLLQLDRVERVDLRPDGKAAPEHLDALVHYDCGEQELSWRRRHPASLGRYQEAVVALGLDLAWRIVVEKHGGNISVQSRPGDTRFAVCLPLVAPAPLTPTPGQLSAAGTE